MAKDDVTYTGYLDLDRILGATVNVCKSVESGSLALVSSITELT